MEREIDNWECVRRALPPDASAVAVRFVELELAKLRYELALRERPRIWGRRASDPRPTLLMLNP